MDRQTMISDGVSYNMAEIWPFPTNGGGGVPESGGGFGFGMRREQLGPNLGQFVNEMNLNREVTFDDPMSVSRTSGQKQHDEEFESPKGLSTSNGTANAMIDSDGKRLKASACRDNHDAKAETEALSSKPADENGQHQEPSKQDYIHVRARRGQATDSHSLAERARREKISERMKILQDLVPGCNKVIGKALVLDEIINYIQSLQRQVEFLSMKLETVNSQMSPGTEILPPKDFGQQAFDTAGMAFASHANREYGHGSSPEWLHMQVGSGFERAT